MDHKQQPGLVICSKSPQTFKKCNNHLKILGITTVSWSYILRVRKILGTIVQNLVPHDLWIPDLQKCITAHEVGQPIWYVWSEYIFNLQNACHSCKTPRDPMPREMKLYNQHTNCELHRSSSNKSQWALYAAHLSILCLPLKLHNSCTTYNAHPSPVFL
jgi:hypothetical protein